ncbi:enoyl-CoA hydratase/isomerase family protein [Sinomonas susongensis]|uniref:enoyl-CoA hydratase/isomerase family protein n=1 Tax=Sinomonas susongensis TaxID=1324851 RepID=UPI001108E292|nr:enoyl-CoA hydratase/isomerase family protein [Sinomonas susongensis]
MTGSGAGVREGVSVDVVHDVATVAFGNGERLNALGMEQWGEVGRAARKLASAESLRAVVVRGRGGVFSAGSDLREWAAADPEEVNQRFWRMEQALRAVEDLPVPTVAVVEGVAAGGGFQLALACDLQLTAASARVGMPISRLGILVPPSFAARLSLRVGPARAKDLLYGGRILTGEEAHDAGLVTTLADDGELDAELGRLLEAWAGSAPGSLRAAKAAVDFGLRPLVGPIREEPPGLATDPDEFPERVAAFLHRHRR